jgi:hypothetical protein
MLARKLVISSKNLSSLFLAVVYFFSFFLIARILNISLHPRLNLWLTALIYAVSYSAIYYINAYSDREFDQKFKNFNIYDLAPSKRRFWLELLLIAIVGLTIVSFISLPAALILFSIYALITVYSLPPLRLKKRPGLRFLALSLNYGLKTLFAFFLMGAAISGQTRDVFLLSIAVVGFAACVYKKFFYKKAYKVYSLEVIFFFLSLFSYLVYWLGKYRSQGLQILVIVAAYSTLASFVYKIREAFIDAVKTTQKDKLTKAVSRLSNIFVSKTWSGVFLGLILMAMVRKGLSFLPVLAILLYSLLMLFVVLSVLKKHSLDTKSRKGRAYLFGIMSLTTFAYLSLALFFRLVDQSVARVFLIILLSLIGMYLLNKLIRISIHLGLNTGLLLILFFLLGRPPWGLLLLIPIGWTRLILKKHTLLEVIAGIVVVLVAGYAAGPYLASFFITLE